MTESTITSRAVGTIIAIIAFVLCVTLGVTFDVSNAAEKDNATVVSSAENADTPENGEEYGMLSPQYAEQQLAKQEQYIQDTIQRERLRERFAAVTDNLPKIHELGGSVAGYHSQAAVDAGGIVEWDSHWYCAHDYDAGGQFYDFREGDVVRIDDTPVVIDGAAYYNYLYNTISDVRGELGYDNYLFQTCLPEGGGAIVIYYGHVIESDAAYRLIAA